MADVNTMRKDLEDANAVTNEIAADIQSLMDRLTTPGLSQEETEEIAGKLASLKVKLTGVAAAYTPPTPDEPIV